MIFLINITIFCNFLRLSFIMIKICVLICGKMRSIDIVIHTFNKLFDNAKYQCKYHICTEYNNDETEYLNNTTIADIMKCNVEKVIFVNRVDECYRNALNYANKLSNCIMGVSCDFDLYIVCRSDFILFNTSSIEFILNDKHNKNAIYFPHTKNNRIDVKNQICEHMMVCKQYETLKQLQNIYQFATQNATYIENILYDYVKYHNLPYFELDVEYKLLLSKCNIISISGDSGSGKSTLLEKLEILFNNGNILKLETDRYHKWERGDTNYLQYSHLNPQANYIEKMYNDTYNLKIGNDIHAVDYDHSTGKFTQISKIETKANVILCGLHTLYDDKLNGIIDIKIFVDTDRELVAKWKIIRDVAKRGHTIEHVKKQIQARENDYKLYIETQKENADICINFYEKCNELKCNFVVKNQQVINKILKCCINYYNIIKNGNEITIELLGCLMVGFRNEITTLTDIQNIKYDDGFYGEIQILMLIILYT